MPVASLLCFAAAQAVLFRLYLPHRYTYPLIPFFAIAAAVLLRPTWDALARAPRGRCVLRRGVRTAAARRCSRSRSSRSGRARRSRRSGTPALLAVAVAGVAAAAVAGARRSAALGARADRVRARGGDPRRLGPARARLALPDAAGGRATSAALPKDAVIAGDPGDLKCLPATAKRAVVISTQLAPAYEVGYFLRGRQRMFADLRAVYGPSRAAIGGAARPLRRDGSSGSAAGRRRAGGAGRASGRRPYGPFVRACCAQGTPASLALPASCLRFRRGADEVYDIACVQRAGDS